MKNFFYTIGIILFFLLVNSCASSKRNVSCIKYQVLQNPYQDQKGYYIKVPENWVVYKDIHCEIVYSPIVNVDRYVISSRVTARVINNKNVPYLNTFTSLEELNNNLIIFIKKTYNTPRIQKTILNHPKLGEYSILKFNTIIGGKIYIKTYVNFLQKNHSYSIIFNVEKSNFNKELNEIKSIINSFAIKK